MEYNKQHHEITCEDSSCPFYRNCPRLRTTTVRVREDTDFDLMFIGQGAGEQEERQRCPFVGPAGRVLSQETKPIIDAEKLNVILDNTIRSRPLDENGKNRKPELNEVDHCIHFVWERIEQFKPTVIVPVGASAAGDMIPKLRGKSISSMRGKCYEHRGKLFMPTYHPAASLHARGEAGEVLRAEMANDIRKAVAKVKEIKTSGQMELL